MEENVIECKNLTHYYGSRLIYENLNFSVKKGHIMGLLGKNGCGKTTTINILNGFLQPRSGECLIYGESTQNLSPETKRRLGYLIEGHIQYSFMNIYQIEKFYSGFYKNWNRDAYFELMNRMKILPSQKVSSMSCGQRAQVALGLILAQDPDLLILDDFSLGLDPGYRRLFVDHMREYAKSGNKTVFLTSHIIQDMDHLAKSLIFFKNGQLLDFKSPQELILSLKQFFYETIVSKKDLQKYIETYHVSSIVPINDDYKIKFFSHKDELFPHCKEINLEDIYLYYYGDVYDKR